MEGNGREEPNQVCGRLIKLISALYSAVLVFITDGQPVTRASPNGWRGTKGKGETCCPVSFHKCSNPETI